MKLIWIGVLVCISGIFGIFLTTITDIWLWEESGIYSWKLFPLYFNSLILLLAIRLIIQIAR